MRRRNVLLAVLALAALATPVHAQTVAQQQMMADVDADFAAKVPDTDKACGTAIKASIDWPGFLKSEIGQNSVSAYCAAPLDTMQSMCADAMAKQAIAAKVKTYTCAFGGPGKKTLFAATTTRDIQILSIQMITQGDKKRPK